MTGGVIWTGVLLTGAIFGASPKPIEIGTPLPAAPAMKAATGETVQLSELPADVLVLLVTCNECPVAVSYEGRFVEFAKKHGGSGSKVHIVAINPYDRTGDTLEDMKARASSAGFPFPYAQDADQSFTRALGALKTPHVFVFGKDRRLAYHGAFDDNWADPTAVKRTYLEEVVTALLDGKPVPGVTKPEGCTIHYEPPRSK